MNNKMDKYLKYSKSKLILVDEMFKQELRDISKSNLDKQI